MTRHTKELLICLFGLPLGLAALFYGIASQPSQSEQTRASAKMTTVGWPD